MASNYNNPINILDSKNATGLGSGGSLNIEGGVSIKKDTFIGGSLSVSGTSTAFSDNIMIMNQNPSSSKDTGILFERYSQDIIDEKKYSGLIYSETSDEFIFGYANSDNSGTGITFGNYIPIKANGLLLISTENSLGLGSGGSLTVLGGASISESLNVNNITTSSINVTNLLSSPSYTGGSLSLSGDLIVGGSVVTVNITTTNVKDINISTGTLNVSDSAYISNATISTLTNTNAISTNISSATLTLSTGLTSASAQITNVNVTTSTIATLRNTNAVSTNVSAATLNLSTGVTTGSLQAELNTGLIALRPDGSNGNLLRYGGGGAKGDTLRFVGITDIERMRIDNNGLVGIGTSSPAYLLDVNGGARISTGITTTNVSAATLNLSTAESGLITLRPDGSNGNLLRYGGGGAKGDTLRFVGITDIERMRIDNNGLVGIGTSSPAYLLDVNGDARISTGLTTGNINFTGDLYKNGVLYQASSQWETGVSNSIFYTSGNVGINTTNPTYTLDVNGSASISTGLTTGGLEVTGLGDITNLTTTTATMSNLYLNSTSIQLGASAGITASGLSTVAIGSRAGQSSQASFATALGAGAGYLVQGTNAVAIGASAGNSKQGTYTVAVGSQAGQNSQGNYAIAIGRLAGYQSQGTYTISMGFQAGYQRQQDSAVAIGYQSAYTTQALHAIAIGRLSGYQSQGSYAIAMGSSAGYDRQTGNAIAIGAFAANTNQGNAAIAIGQSTAYNYQGAYAIAIGQGAANLYQGSYGIAIGIYAGGTSQGSYAIAIGASAGSTNQHANSIIFNATGSALESITSGATYIAPMRNVTQANLVGYDASSNEVSYFSLSDITTTNLVATNISTGTLNLASLNIKLGFGAGQSSQSPSGIAIGVDAGNNSQGNTAVAIGYYAGNYNQGGKAVAIGDQAGYGSQSANAIAIGTDTGFAGQGQNAVAIGFGAGNDTQNASAIAIGNAAGNANQGTKAIAMGENAGNFNQGSSAIAIGVDAGKNNQGSYAIAIGYAAGQTNQHNSTLILSASPSVLNSVTAGTTYIAPMRQAVASSRLVMYNPTTKEVVYSSANSATNKTFVINHPVDDEKYLVHGCLEGPEAGVYYRGKGEIKNGESCVIKLPEYVSALDSDFTVQLTPIYNGRKMEQLYTSKVENGVFTVYGENCEFYWLVQGSRLEIEVEPLKSSVQVKGTGPYKWI